GPARRRESGNAAIPGNEVEPVCSMREASPHHPGKTPALPRGHSADSLPRVGWRDAVGHPGPRTPRTLPPDIPMNMHRPLLVAALAAAAGLAFAPVTSSAQTAAAPASNPLGGNPVPGVCMLSREAVFAESKVGQAASERLKQLATQQQSLLENQRKPLDAEIQAFQQKSSTLTEAQRQ